jgi:hypothetical protein
VKTEPSAFKLSHCHYRSYYFWSIKYQQGGRESKGQMIEGRRAGKRRQSIRRGEGRKGRVWDNAITTILHVDKNRTNQNFKL